MTDMYNTFDDCTFDLYMPTSFGCKHRKYLLNKYSPNACWNYGDSAEVCIKINTHELPEEFGNYTYIVDFYNFRGESIYRTEMVPNDNSCLSFIKVSIDSKTSAQTFYKGTYTCSIKAISDLYQYTLEDNYRIYVY